MYKVRRKEFRFHTDARNAAKSASAVFPVRLKSPTGGAWYWRGQYRGRSFLDLFRKAVKDMG